MGRMLTFALLVAIVGGGTYLLMNYSVSIARDGNGARTIKIVRRTATAGTAPASSAPANLVPAAVGQTTIRIATFNVDRLDAHKLANRQVNDVLLRLIPHFDILAVQGLQSRNVGLLHELVEQVNAMGHHYDFAAGKILPEQSAELFGAFLFDRRTIEIDHALASPIRDPAGWFRRRPLVAEFRTRGADPAAAFTFKLINVHTDLDRAEAELDLLDNVYQAVRDDRTIQEGGPSEDDVILLGDLAADPANLGELGKLLDITVAVTSTPTTFRGTRPIDNILFNRRATTEFTGRAGVLDLMRQFDLTPEIARQVSRHLPVWAEFSTIEGGDYDHLAKQPGASAPH